MDSLCKDELYEIIKCMDKTCNLNLNRNLTAKLFDKKSIHINNLECYSYINRINVHTNYIKIINIENNKKLIKEVISKVEELFGKNRAVTIRDINSPIEEEIILQKVTSAYLSSSCKFNIKKLVNLKTAEIYNKEFLNDLPKSVQNMSIFCYPRNTIINYPPNLVKLRLINANETELNNIPESVKKIYLHGITNYNIEKLGDTIKELYIYDNYNRAINKFPKNLEILVFPLAYEHKIINLPLFLKKIKLPNMRDNEIKNLPEGLLEINVYSYNKILKDLPNSIEIIRFVKNYHNEINKLPESLKLIECPNEVILNPNVRISEDCKIKII